MAEYFGHTLKLLGGALMSIRDEEFLSLVQACKETLESGHKVIASGLGKNVPVCEKFEGTMLSLGLDCSFLHTNSAVHGDLGKVKNGDLVILLTKSGATAESVFLYEQLKKRECTVWLMSFNRDSELYRTIPNHLIIELEHEGDLWNIMPNNSTILNMIVLQSVAIELAKVCGVCLDDFKANHPGGAIGEELA